MLLLFLQALLPLNSTCAALLLLITACCAAGQYLVNDPATCTDCPVGSYCPGGTTTQSVIYSCNWAKNATTDGLTTKAVRSTSRAACGE
jgi:hypothetical protein